METDFTELNLALNEKPELHIWPNFLQNISVDEIGEAGKSKILTTYRMPRPVEIDPEAAKQIDIMLAHRISLMRNRSEFVNIATSTTYWRAACSNIVGVGHRSLDRDFKDPMSSLVINEFVRRVRTLGIKGVVKGLYVIVMGGRAKTQLLADSVFADVIHTEEGEDGLKRIENTEIGWFANFNSCALFVDSNDREIHAPDRNCMESIAFGADPLTGNEFPVARYYKGAVEAFTVKTPRSKPGELALNWRAKELFEATENMDGETAKSLTALFDNSIRPVEIRPKTSRAIHKIWTVK